MIAEKVRSEICKVRESVGRYSGIEVPLELSRKMNLLLDVDSYIRSLEWTSFIPRMWYSAFLNGMELDEIARLYNVSVVRIESAVQNADSVLLKLLGAVMGFLSTGEVARAESEFMLRTGRGLGCPLFPSFIHSNIRAIEHVGVDMGTCEPELHYLSSHALFQAEVDRFSLDQEKLEHLMYIIMSDARDYRTVRCLLLRCLEGQSSSAEAVETIADYYYSLHPTYES